MGEMMVYSGTLVMMRCWCGISHAVPSELANEQERQHRDGHKQLTLYCPLGHTHIIAGPSEIDGVRSELTRANNGLARERAAHDQTRARLSATKGALTKTKRRVANGVCPCCHRTFVNVARHMRSQHPDYETTETPPA